MNNTTLGFFIGITLCFCIWFLNSVVNSKETITENTAFITIINKSDFKIKKALLEHGCGELTVSDIGIGKTAYLGFYNGGENAYTLTVELENGEILESIGHYFERGLRATETIINSKIYQENNRY